MKKWKVLLTTLLLVVGMSTGAFGRRLTTKTARNPEQLYRYLLDPEFRGDVVFDSTNDVTWDTSIWTFHFADDAILGFGNTPALPDIYMRWDETDFDILSTATDETPVINIGVNSAGIHLKLFGATSGASLLWDATNDALELGGATLLEFTERTAPGTPGSKKAWLYVKEDGATSDLFYEDDGGNVINLSGAAAGSLDAAYNGGSTIDVDSGAVTLTVSDTDGNRVLDLVQNDTTGNPEALRITNTGSGDTLQFVSTGGNDIDGSGSTWSVTSVGALTAVSGDFTGAAGITLQLDETITNATQSEIALTDSASARGLIFDLDASATTVGLKPIGAVTGLAFGDVDALTGVGSIAFDAEDSSMSLAADGTDDLTIAVTGAQDARLLLQSEGTEEDAIAMSTSAGGMTFTVAGAAAGEDITLTSSTSINLLAAEGADLAILLQTSNAAGQIAIDSADTSADGIVVDSAGGMDFTTAGAGDDMDFLATGGRITATATEAAVDQFKVDVQGTVANSGTAGAMTFETTDGGIVFIVDGSANGDVLFDVESSWFLKIPDALDDVFRIYSSAGVNLIEIDLNATDQIVIGDNTTGLGEGAVGVNVLVQGSLGAAAAGTTAGQVGGTAIMLGGTGGVAVDASVNLDGGIGGATTVQGGTGGAAATDENAAAGGAANFLGGTGGAGDGTGTAGAGGVSTARGGTGGGATTDVDGGAGGAFSVAGGTGGLGAGTQTGGVGGALNLAGGVAGAANGGTGGNGGVLNLDGGAGVTGGNVTVDAGVGSTTSGNVTIAAVGLVNALGNASGTLALTSSDWTVSTTGVVTKLASIAFDDNSSPTVTVAGNGSDTFTISQTGSGSDDHLIVEGQGNSADALTLKTTTNAGGILISSVGGLETTTTAAFQTYTTNSKQHKKIYIPLSMGLTQATDIMVAAPGSPLQCTGLDAGVVETGAAEGLVAVGDAADILIFEFQLPDDFIDTGTQADLILTFDIAEQAAEDVDIDVRIFDYNNGTHTTPIITDTIISTNGAGRTEEGLESNAAGIGNQAEIDAEDVLVIELTQEGSDNNEDFNIYGIWITYRTGVEATQ